MKNTQDSWFERQTTKLKDSPEFLREYISILEAEIDVLTRELEAKIDALSRELKYKKPRSEDDCGVGE